VKFGRYCGISKAIRAPGPNGFTIAFFQKCWEVLKDFRPISLIGGMYKIISQVLANKLKSVLGKIVSNSQTTFIIGR